MKKPTTLYLDAEVVEALRKQGVNISEVVNRYLRAILCRDSEVARIQQQIWELEAQLREVAAREILLAKLEPYVEYYKKMEARGWKGLEGGKQRWLEESARRLGLTPGELEAYCKGARKVG